MFFSSINFDVDQGDNNLIPFNDNTYNPQTNYHQDLYSVFHRIQHETINGDPAAVEGLPGYSDLLCLATRYDPIDPFVGLFMDDNNNLSHGTKKDAKKRKRIVDIKSDIQWTEEEDRLLVDLVEKYGAGKWSSIAQMLTGRIEKQCRDRWLNHLKPGIKKHKWSEKEDQILIKTHMQLGNKWSEILRFLPGRSEKAIKNHWNVAKNSRNSKFNDTPLQNYIRSLVKTGGKEGVERDPNKRRRRGELDDVRKLQQLHGIEE